MTVFNPTAAVDVVGVYDDSFAQMFQQARPLKASIVRGTRIFTHPLEDGAMVSDHKVFDPVSIELSLVIVADDYKAVYQQIKTAYMSNSLLRVQTRADVFERMTIESMPHEEDADMFDAIPVALKMKEVQLVRAQFQALPPRAVSKAGDQSTNKRGEQNPKDGGNKGSVAYRILYGK